MKLNKLTLGMGLALMALNKELEGKFIPEFVNKELEGKFIDALKNRLAGEITVNDDIITIVSDKEYIVNFKYHYDCSIVTKSKELFVKAIDEQSAVNYAKLHYPNVNVNSIKEKKNSHKFAKERGIDILDEKSKRSITKAIKSYPEINDV